MKSTEEIIHYLKQLIEDIHKENYNNIIRDELQYFEDDEPPRKLIIFYELMEKFWINKDFDRYYKLRHIIERYKEILFN